MAISNNYVPIRQLGNGSTVNFSASWSMLNAAYAQVFLEDAVTGVQTAVTQGAGAGKYTIVITSSGFTVTFGTAPTSGQYAVIGRAVSLDQTVPYTTSKGFQGDVEEGSFDKLTAMVQDLSNIAARSLKFALGSTANGFVPAPIDGYGLIWDGTSGALRNTSSSLAVLEGNAAIVAANIGAINTVASNISAIITANANSTNINIVATNIANVNAVGSNIANVNTVAGISANVTTVAGISANVTTVAGISAAVSTVASISAAVSTVATNATAVSTVATNIAAVNTAASNIAAIIAAPAAAALVQSAVHSWLFDSSTTSADPGTGKVRFNNATIGSVTNLYLSNLTNDSGNPNLTTFIQTWDDSTNTLKGTITIAKANGNNAIFSITGAITNNTTWSIIPVTFVSNGGTIAAADALGIGFVRAGDKGANGTGTGDFSTNTISSSTGEIVVYGDASGKLGARSLFVLAGPATTAKTYTFPNASCNILTDNAAVTVAQGGSGLQTLPTGQVLIGAGTSSITSVSASTTGNVLTANGTTWVSSAPSGGQKQSFSSTTSGTFTTSAGITTSTKFDIEIWGGGNIGGVGGASNTGGSGGGGGSCTLVLGLTGLNPSTGYSYTIGANTGGTTSITINAVTYTAPGGSAGVIGSGSNPGVLGGKGGVAGANGTIMINGNDGGTSSPTVSGHSVGGYGGAGFRGLGSVAGAIEGTNAVSSITRASGGAGGALTSGVAATAVGGIIVITWNA